MSLSDGTVRVDAVIDGKRQQCILDTGSQVVSVYSPMGHGNWFRVKSGSHQFVDIVPRIQIGSFEGRGIAAIEEVGRTRTSLLGDSLFRTSVVSIDYRRGTVQFRDKGYARTLRRRCRPLRNLGHDFLRDVPIVEMNVNGKNIPCIIDTGSNTSVVDVDTPEFRQLIGKRSGRARFPGGQADVYWTKQPIPVLLGGREIGSIHLGIRIPAGIRVLIGNDILRNFRVTIDYPDGITYLEPYDKVGGDKSR